MIRSSSAGSGGSSRFSIPSSPAASMTAKARYGLQLGVRAAQLAAGALVSAGRDAWDADQGAAVGAPQEI
jgi:hypothetical protein